MIPKLIHYVWLSGEEKPELIKNCIKSWKKELPDYTIKEWSMNDIRDIKSPFLWDAIEAKKWAFATDFLRFYIIYNYGGIYMDSDIYVYRNIDIFLNSHGFTSLEGSGILNTESKNKVQDFGLEAAFFGAEKNSSWIKNILDFYTGLRFQNTPQFYMSIIAPKVMWQQTVKFGLRKLPSFQLLEDNIKIYPLDIFSCIADYSVYGLKPSDYKKVGEINPLRYTCHLCSNSCGWKKRKTFKEKTKEYIIKIIGPQLAVNIKRIVYRTKH